MDAVKQQPKQFTAEQMLAALQKKGRIVSSQRDGANEEIANLAADLEIAREQIDQLLEEIASRDTSIAMLRDDLVRARADFDTKLAALKGEIEAAFPSSENAIVDGTAEVAVGIVEEVEEGRADDDALSE